jgi:hypothetical protein
MISGILLKILFLLDVWWRGGGNQPEGLCGSVVAYRTGSRVIEQGFL